MELVGRHGHDGQVDLVGDGAQVGIGPHAVHVGGVAVDGVHRSVEAAGQQLAQHLMAEGAGAATGPYHRDGGRGQHPGHGGGLGPSTPVLDVDLAFRRGANAQVHLHHAVAELGGDLETGPAKHVDHAPVVGQHAGDEPVDAGLAGRHREELQQQGGQAPTVVAIIDEKGHLRPPPAGWPLVGRGGVGKHTVVTGHADEVLPQQGDQGQPGGVVDGGETGHVALGQTGAGRKKPVVNALGRLAAVEGDQTLGVIGADGPHVDRAPVGQNHVCFPAGRIVPCRLRGLVHGASVGATCVALRRAPRDLRRSAAGTTRPASLCGGHPVSLAWRGRRQDGRISHA